MEGKKTLHPYAKSFEHLDFNLFVYERSNLKELNKKKKEKYFW
jgi:hypothetical protein